MKPRKKLDRTAEKNTLNGILAKNKFATEKVNEPFSLALTLFVEGFYFKVSHRFDFFGIGCLD